MAGDLEDGDGRVTRRVNSAARLVGSNHFLWERTKANGVPRWTLWVVSVAAVLGAAGAVGVYAASRSLLAALVILGICWLVALAVLSMADLGRGSRD